MASLTRTYLRPFSPLAQTQSLLAIKTKSVDVTDGSNRVTALPSVISRSMFYQKDSKGPGYSRDERRGRPRTEIEVVTEAWQNAKEGFKLLPGEFEKWKQEKKIDLQGNRILDMMWDYPDGCFQKEFEFRGRESLKDWIVSTDRDWGEGFTKAELTVSKNNMALFQGHLCTDLPVEGTIERAGYANIKSRAKLKSFQRDDRYNWTHFTHFIARVRGDGRNYIISLHTPGYFDLTWNDTFHYFLFTRGGPYWQYVKIPFSKFFFGAKGAIQDGQFHIPLDEVNSIGLTVMDTYDGPFQLEIDYIGVLHDKTHNTTFEYEQYKLDLAEMS